MTPIGAETIVTMAKVAKALEELVEDIDSDVPFYLSPVVLTDEDGNPLASFWDDGGIVMIKVHEEGRQRTDMADLLATLYDTVNS